MSVRSHVTCGKRRGTSQSIGNVMYPPGGPLNKRNQLKDLNSITLMALKGI